MQARLYRAPDAEALTTLHQAAFEDPSLGPSYWRAARASAPSLCTVAEDEGRLLAYCTGFTAGEGGDVVSVASDPSVRGRGAARAAMALFLSEAARRGASALHLEVSPSNARAIRLYEGLGFARVGLRTRYYADGADALVMACPLDGALRAV